MKKCAFFIILLFCFGRMAAQVTETNEGGDVQQTLNTLFQNVNTGQAPSGFLMNKAIYFANIHNYDGTIISDSTDMNINTFSWLYAMMDMAKVPGYTLPAPEPLYGENSYTGGVIPLVMMCQRYSHFKTNIFSDNLMTFSNNQLFDVAGRTEAPYAEDTVFAVCPVIDKFKTGNLSFVLSYDRFVQNVGNMDVSFDFGTGNGFQAVTFGQPFSVSLPSGMNRAVVQVVTRKGRVLRCRFEIEVEPAPLTPEGGLDAIYDPADVGLAPPANIPRTITADRTWNGQAATAEVTIFYACADRKLRKPLLVLDGFNSNADIDAVRDIDFITLFNAYRNTPISTNLDRAITRELRLEGYDLVFVNWKSEDGRDDLRRYAYLLEKILANVNTEKAANGSTEKNVIIGLSMGGVIAKYALRDLERLNPSAANGKHDVKQLFTYDSPMQGANIPLGLQYLIKDLGEDMLGGLGRFLSGKLRGGLKRLKNPAAQQLLIYQAFDGNPFAPSGFTSFYNELNSWGALEKCDYKTVSNGSLIGTANFPAAKKLFGGTAFLPPIIVVGVFLDIDVRALPNGSSTFESVYKRTLILKVGIIPPIFPYISRKNILVGSSIRPLDGAPGGTTDLTNSLDKAIPFMRSGRYDDGNGEILNPTFIPVVSALDLKSPERNNPFFNVSNVVANQTTQATGVVGSRSNSQFDAAVFFNDLGRIPNQTHVGLSYRTTGFLLYDLITKDALRTVPNGILNNRTYNFGTNAQGFPTNPPSPGSFQPKVSNNIIDYTLSVENTGQLWVNRGGKVGFTDNTNGVDNTSNSTYTLIIRKGDACTVTTDGILNIRNNGVLRVGDPSVTNAAIVKIQAGGTLRIQNTGNLIVENNSRIEIESGGKLIFDVGANINLLGANAQIIIKNGGQLIINGSFFFTGNGYFNFEAGNILALNADWTLIGSGKTTRLINIANNATVFINGGRKLRIENALIRKEATISNQDVMRFNDGSTFTANNVTFDDQSMGGGAFAFIAVDEPVDLDNSQTDMDYSFTGCAFNRSDMGVFLGGDGGGVYDFRNLNVAFVNTTFTDCQTAYLAQHGYETTFDGCTILRGGLDIRRTYWLQMRNTVMRGNRAATGNNSTIGVKLSGSIHNWITDNCIISDYGTGIEAFTGAEGFNINGNIRLADKAAIQLCNTAIRQRGGVDYGLLYMDCAAILENNNGITGTDILLSAYSRGNTANIYTRPMNNSTSLFFDNTFNVRNETDVFLFGSYWDNPTYNASLQPPATTFNNFWHFLNGNGFWTGTMHLEDFATSADVNNCGGVQTRDAKNNNFDKANAVVRVNGENRDVRIQHNAALAKLRQKKLREAIALFVPIASINNVTRNPANGVVRHCIDVARVMAKGMSDVTIRSESNNWLPETLVETPREISEELIIYPNPANNSVHLTIKNGNYHLRVLNTVGQTIFEQNTDGVLSVNVTTWTNGIYLFELIDKTTNKRQHSKIIVQH